MTRQSKRTWVMDHWLDLLEEEPPRVPNAPVLYHYTDAFGLHGIVTSNCLWASAAQFSNDASEIEYAVVTALEIVEEQWESKKRLSPWEKLLADHVRQLLLTPLHTFGQPFLVSFCEDGDLLSQWRAYGRNSGFSLAFSPLTRNERDLLVCKDGFRTVLRRIVYEPDKQRARLRYILKNLIKLVNAFPFTLTSPRGASAHVELSLILLLELTDWVCTVKHEAFSEEREWRIITYPRGATLVGIKPEDFKGVSVRPTSKLLLPYMVLEPSSGKRLPLVGIRCGPGRLQEQSGRALKILLRNHGYPSLPITFSEVPLRT
jgi:hypothetical protein